MTLDCKMIYSPDTLPVVLSGFVAIASSIGIHNIWPIWPCLIFKLLSTREKFFIHLVTVLIRCMFTFRTFLVTSGALWPVKYHHHHHHHVLPQARISLTLFRHFSLSFIASGRFSGLHPVSSHTCCIYIRAGRPTFARPYVGVHRSKSLMSSSLLLQLCPACLIRLTWLVFVMEGRWPYSSCFVSISSRITRSGTFICATFKLHVEWNNVQSVSTPNNTILLTTKGTSCGLNWFSHLIYEPQTCTGHHIANFWQAQSIETKDNRRQNLCSSFTNEIWFLRRCLFQYTHPLSLSLCFSLSLSLSLSLSHTHTHTHNKHPPTCTHKGPF